MMNNAYIAHKNDKNEIQTIKQHAEETAELCREYAIPEWKDFMYILGLLHDCGKYMESFQRKIKCDENIRVEHSICGAKEAYDAYDTFLGVMMAFCIAGHHTGLPDGGTVGDEPNMPTLEGRMQRKSENYNYYKKELTIPQLDELKLCKFIESGFIKFASNSEAYKNQLVDHFAFWTRYAFSCLVDADYTNTANFMDRNSEIAEMKADFEKALEMVNVKLNSFKCVTDLQKCRSTIQNQVFSKANIDADIYLMNMPTGSGKTLCSVKFALERAIKKKKKRIIYIIPYNSIIDQTAAEFEELFGNQIDILRHQSSYSYETDNMSQEKIDMLRTVTENWDAPFIITTAVQFFESVQNYRGSKLRKLHNMSDSILVFDEAHLMPVKFLQPCLQSIGYITKYLNSEALFLTATMPDFKKLINKYVDIDNTICNLITDKSSFPKFQRCTYDYLKSIGDSELLSQASKFASTLIIVGKKEKAKMLFEEAKGDKYHLSTYMVTKDRKRTIKNIKKRLKRLEQKYGDSDEIPENEKIIVISTSLIEAGVDLDFHKVYREVAGLDSIIQAAGRCNREGKRENAVMSIFRTENSDESDMKRNITKNILETGKDIFSPKTIMDYYKAVYGIEDENIKKMGMHMYEKDCNYIPFRKYADDFKMIDGASISIVVGLDEYSTQIIDEMKRTGKAKAKELQNYTCSVNSKDFKNLTDMGVIDDYGTGIWCLTDMSCYNPETGIDIIDPEEEECDK